MALQNLLAGGVDYVQDSQPSNPENGEIWLDTSTSPSKLRVRDNANGNWDEANGTIVKDGQPISADLISRIYSAVELRVTETWSTGTELDEWETDGSIRGARTTNDRSITITKDPGGSHIFTPGDKLALADYKEEVFYDTNSSFDDTQWYEVTTLSIDVTEYDDLYLHTEWNCQDKYAAWDVRVTNTTDGNEIGYVSNSHSGNTSYSGGVDEWDVSGLSGTKDVLFEIVGTDGDSSQVTVQYSGVMVPIVSGSTSSPSVSPSPISQWELLNSQVANGEYVSFDIIESDTSNEYLTGLSGDGSDISSVPRTTGVNIGVNLSRPSESIDLTPEVDLVSIGWLE